MTDKTDLIREIHEYVTAHGGENTATHLLVQAASAIQTQAAELEAVGAGGMSGPLVGRAALSANAGEPVAHLWQHCETGRTRIVMPDMIVDADASWQVVGPLYLGAAPPTAQAEGWRLVPLEPTDEMLNATYAGQHCSDVYRDMLAAAPTPPTSAEGVEHG